MFRFTIRELVLLTLVVAMGVGWWLDRRRSSWSVLVPDTTVIAEGLEPGDKLEFELLPNGQIAKRIIRRP